MKKVKLLINGYGRVGRILHRIMIENDEKSLEVAAINSRASAESHAHLLKYDSTYGILKKKVSYGRDFIKVNDRKIKVYLDKNPGEINFKKEGIDIVAECTGKFRDGENCQKQIEAGARKVAISAPSNGEDISVVFGVNQNDYQNRKHHLVSNASCTTNCLAAVIKVLKDNFGINLGQMTTIHALTKGQNMLDGSHKKNMRIARAAIESFIPTTTGASKAINKIFPDLDGKLDALSVRAPLSTVSLVDLVVDLKKKTSAEEINKVFMKESKGKMKGFLGITMEPLVSIDFRGDSRSAIVDGLSTSVVGGRLAKILAWYDNEWGYCCRLYDLLKLIARKL